MHSTILRWTIGGMLVIGGAATGAFVTSAGAQGVGCMEDHICDIQDPYHCEEDLFNNRACDDPGPGFLCYTYEDGCP